GKSMGVAHGAGCVLINISPASKPASSVAKPPAFIKKAGRFLDKLCQRDFGFGFWEVSRCAPLRFETACRKIYSICPFTLRNSSFAQASSSSQRSGGIRNKKGFR